MSLYDDASLIMYPSGYKADKIYSLKPTDGSGDLTFTRASTATRVNADGLIEGVRTNSILYSEQFNDASWTKSNATITANNTTAPNGTLTADKVVVSANTDNVIQTGLAFVGVGNSNTISIYIKGSGSNIGKEVGLYIDRDGVGTYEASTVVGTLTAEWQRIEVTHTWVNSQSSVRFKISQAIATTPASEFFIWGAQLEASASATEYIPTTTAAVSVGMLADVPRIDYTGGGCGSLLLEKQSTNLALYSEQFDNAYWTKFDDVITANSSISPDGTTNADKTTPNTTNTFHGIFRNIGSLGAGTYCGSVFLKANGYNFGYIRLTSNASANYIVVINLTNGQFTATSQSGSPTGTSFKVDNYGNGWFRLSATSTQTSGDFYMMFGASNVAVPTFTSDIPSFAGNGTSGIYVWGAQIEASSYKTSYIPTLASSVTRLADSASKTGISSLIGQTQGTIFLDFVAQASSTSGSHIWITGTSGNEIGIYGNTQFIFYSSGGVSINGGGYTTGQRYKLAFAYKNNDYVAYVNGVQKGTDTSATVPATSALYVNSYSDFTEIQNKQVNQALLFPTRLTNTQLAELTTI